ncbi:uncharacterized protein THITE_2129894 [Thermothielavioides terrestris NRRL 8126]|uniref:Uncharacterized protein n=1 Tax=Thermothielavioides terrestris (strain ATCC 38088 / NRRL 8126) TaxID=578455 RepID=G2R849_THETT|nr:uncharacterized protein THITE_2129894 [Thermothielavioides terrestris NRRL 8126]AEO68108.1 hypothetical protein THITE_2129894 [Thermothielavioides terrestris NRRL 8126]
MHAPSLLPTLASTLLAASAVAGLSAPYTRILALHPRNAGAVVVAAAALASLPAPVLAVALPAPAPGKGHGGAHGGKHGHHKGKGKKKAKGKSKAKGHDKGKKIGKAMGKSMASDKSKSMGNMKAMGGSMGQDMNMDKAKAMEKIMKAMSKDKNKHKSKHKSKDKGKDKGNSSGAGKTSVVAMATTANGTTFATATTTAKATATATANTTATATANTTATAKATATGGVGLKVVPDAALQIAPPQDLDRVAHVPEALLTVRLRTLTSPRPFSGYNGQPDANAQQTNNSPRQDKAQKDQKNQRNQETQKDQGREAMFTFLLDNAIPMVGSGNPILHNSLFRTSVVPWITRRISAMFESTSDADSKEKVKRTETNIQEMVHGLLPSGSRNPTPVNVIGQVEMHYEVRSSPLHPPKSPRTSRQWCPSMPSNSNRLFIRGMTKEEVDKIAGEKPDDAAKR